MATNTILQSLNTDSDFGGVSAAGASNRRVEEVFIAGETLVVGDCVSLDLAKTADSDKGLIIVKGDTGTATDTCVIGVVLRSAEPSGVLTAGARIEVVTRGIVTANVDGATVAGSRLVVGSTAGRLAIAADIVESGSATVNQRPIVAIAVEADTSNLAKVYVLPQF
jgi:hypothetical protein